jgi:hypothetical protein
MEKEKIQRRSKLPKEVYKDVVVTTLRERQKDKRLPGGKDSPESGSLYSDYESGQQYEQDLPSGYNSGEQYDTLSTGYMSGEAYELPEARQELQEPTLASIEEVSTRSNEDLFTLVIPAESQLINQVECLNSSSSSSIDIHARDALDPPIGLLPEGGLHKGGKRKKQVSYCVSVPMEKAPLGDMRIYRDLPSDTDTTSCFDSDGTYMKSDLQSSDSGAALLHVSRKKRREKAGENDKDKGFSRGNRRRLGKVKQIIRNHDEFFLVHDNKYWAMARLICFWCSVGTIISSIIFAGIMIMLMPMACDPQVPWWQGSVILEVSSTSHPANKPTAAVNGEIITAAPPLLDIASVISDIPAMRALGIKAIKLTDLYLSPDDLARNGGDGDIAAGGNDTEVVASRLASGNVAELEKLADSLHAVNMSLLVDIPTYSPNKTILPGLSFRVSNSILFWASKGADGISFLGLEGYATDRFICERLSTWVTDFELFSRRDQRVLITSTQFPELYASGGPDSVEGNSPVDNIHLLEAKIDISLDRNFTQLQEDIEKASLWDRAPSLPWILWKQESSTTYGELTAAQLAIQMLLPGTITLPGDILRSQFNIPINVTHEGSSDEENATHNNETEKSTSMLQQLIKARENAVPLYMNGNFKTCHGSCSETRAEMKQKNFKIQMMGPKLVIMERHYNRRNRYLLCANIGDTVVDVSPVNGLFAGGEVIVDTSGDLRPGQGVSFKLHTGIQPYQALVIKLPK